MKIPDELVIFGRTYRVLEVSPIHVSEGVLGLASYREGAIYLDPSLDAALGLNTIWHEALYIAQQDVLGTSDEAQARWLALFVHNFLIHNPAILGCYLSCMSSDPDSLDPPDEDYHQTEKESPITNL
ncbi:MAG: hypothetical protein HY912_02880 [Desulfomonile tiedjei]|uniref:Uncharacterized protein n=1 Tax=Desulfomonile tiedjei TaxID=2358 RepID=A0A9D6Z4P9_9BACT|nr:hypothetical protein [Desulfomonile tiedjei]